MRSLINKIDQIRILLENGKIDILSLSETWLRKVIPDELIHIDGYKLYRADRGNSGKTERGGGLCVYIKEKFNTEIIVFNDYSQRDIEILSLRICGNKTGTLVCTTIYRPPKGKVESAVTGLQKLCDKLLETTGDKIIHGDFNINYLNKSCRWSKKLKEWEIHNGLFQCIKTPTRITPTSSSMIDLCFSNVKFVSNTGTLNLNVSDHLATFITKKKIREKKQEKRFEGRDYRKLTVEAVREILGQPANNHACEIVDPNLLWYNLRGRYDEVNDKLCPIREYKIKRDRPEYFTTEISNLILTRDKLFKKARTTPDKAKQKILWKKAVIKRKAVRSSIREAKRKYVTSTLEENKKNPKQYWRTMNRFLNRGKKKGTITNIVRLDGTKATGLDAAEMVNDFFCMIGSNLAKKITPATKRFTIESVRCKFKWGSKIPHDDVRKEILALNDGKSSGFSGITSRVLNLCLQSTVPEFVTILNSCVDKGVFPTCWKEGIVVPIPKGDKVKVLENIRPISLLPTPGKILEHLMHHRMYLYLMEHGLLSSKQAGFRKNYGIQDPTIDLIRFVHDRFNERKNVLCIYIDMAKAFNSLAIDILLAKLENLGFQGSFLKLLESYSTNRRQFTNFNGFLSKSGGVEFGVAQGSVLGPLLFSLYMNDLPTIFDVLDIRMYADDTVLFCELNRDGDIGRTVEKVNAELENFSQWCRFNFLTVNTSKTKCMLFSPSCMSKQMLNEKLQIRLNGEILGFVDTYRYLGVELDTKLDMEAHVNNVIRKARPLLYSLAKLRHYVNLDTSVIMYKTYILPVVEFGLYLVDKPAQVNRLQKLQNRAMRICFRESNTSPSFPLHVRADLLSLKLRRRCTLLGFINMKSLRGDPTFPMSNRNDNRTRASGDMYHVNFPHTERYKRSISYTGPQTWNALPLEIRENRYPLTLKSNLRKYYWSVFQENKTVK